MVSINLDIPPGGIRTVWWQIAEINRIYRVADINKRGAVATTHEGVFFTGLGICPSPDVASFAAANFTKGHKGEQVNVAAGIAAGVSADTGCHAHAAQGFRRVVTFLECPHGVDSMQRRVATMGRFTIVMARDGKSYTQKHTRQYVSVFVMS
jgi:hypothetical protein